VRELDEPPDPYGRIRRPGGGPKRLRDTDPGLVEALDRLVDPDTRGDPASPLRWTCKSTRELAEALTAQGHPVSDDTVGKKELVGNFANGGAEWQPSGEPVEVDVHDFPDPALGKAIPYGVYDLGRNTGWVSVGVDHDTAAFAVATLRRWWEQVGRRVHPEATRLLITADAGGSNGYRVRVWKTELARFAADSGLTVTVCHFPPGTSKWNKIEHRLFSAISTNWRGRPLVNHEVIVELIGATTTRCGLRVRAELDRGRYPLGIKVSDQELAAVPASRHTWHGEWNYTILPRAA
jgi:hypothetical protein